MLLELQHRRASFETALSRLLRMREIGDMQHSNLLILRSRKAASRRTHIVGAAFLSLTVFTTPTLAHPGHSPVEDRSTENRDYWIERSVQIHGGFGSLIALGIRIGDDAMRVLEAERRELDVSYYSGKSAPCPCVADGIMAVTMASPGQGTLRVAAEPAEDGVYGRAIFRHRKTGKAVEYTIANGVSALIGAANSAPVGKRWSLIMDAPQDSLFARRFIKASN